MSESIEQYKKIKKILVGTGYKLNNGLYSEFSIYKKDKIKLDNRNYFYDYCLSFNQTEKTFYKSEREADMPFATWRFSDITLKELNMINKIIFELGWEE